MKHDRLMTLWLLAASLGAASSVPGEVRLPHVFGDHMVLQRERPLPVWGWASAGEKVTVTLNGQTAAGTANDSGKWSVALPAMPAGGPYRLAVAGDNIVTFDDVLIGELWVCAGQSNMEWGLVVTRDHDREIAAANFPRIRLFRVPQRRTPVPADDVDSQWQVCSPQTVSYFSAVAYFFGRELQQQLDVPVGLMMAAVGGTRIEPWTAAAGVASVKELAGLDKVENGDLYNGMIHPLTPFSIRGAIWYQGEGNVGDGGTYTHRMRALIGGWRQAFSQADLPFYYVQLAPLNWGGKPVDALPEIWEAQTAALSISHTGMVVTNDIGNTGDAHPRNKQDVGKRLARWALARDYGQSEVVYCGPIYDSMQVEGPQIRIRFRHAGSGLASRDGQPLSWFTIAAVDKVFLPATAVIEGNDVLVFSEAVTDPVAVRFGWHQIAEPNLMNRAGLPASAFRTDRW